MAMQPVRIGFNDLPPSNVKLWYWLGSFGCWKFQGSSLTGAVGLWFSSPTAYLFDSFSSTASTKSRPGESLDDVLTDRRFFVRQSMSACEVAEYILSLIQRGEHDPDILKSSAFKKFSVAQPVRLRSSDPFPTATHPTGRRSEK